MRAVLTYHSLDASGSPISVEPSAFDRHVRWLASGRVRVTTVSELLRLPDDVDAVAITFDDGFRNFATVAAPRLLSHRLPATVFVATDRVGGTNLWDGRPVPGIPTLELLDWPSLRALAAAGFTVGSHTRTHPDLTTLAPAAISDEVGGSAAALQSAVGVTPTAFAYPYGRVSRAAAEAVAATFAAGCTTEFRAVRAGDDAAVVPRLDMYYFQEPGRLEGWGTPAFGRYLSLIRHRRRLRSALAAIGVVHA